MPVLVAAVTGPGIPRVLPLLVRTLRSAMGFVLDVVAVVGVEIAGIALLESFVVPEVLALWICARGIKELWSVEDEQ